MTNDKLPSKPKSAEKPLVKKRTEAVVRCKGFRCMVYLDEHGVWHSVANSDPLEVLEVIFRF